MSLSIPPRPAPRQRLLPGLSLRVGDILGSRFRLDALKSAEKSRIHLAATQIMNRASVSIEIFVPNGEGSDEARLAFVAASRRSAVLNGPHTCKVLHAGVTSEGHPFVAREPAPARTLAALLAERGSLDTTEAVDIALALCDAVGEAHGHAMIHGAIEPRNVRVGPKDIKLMDFETGTIFVDMSADPFARLVMRAPEQLRLGGRMDERTDVFALGAILFTMIAGASPFAAESPSATALALNNDEPAFLAGVEDALAELVEKCLAKEPADRPQDITAVAEALAPFASSKSDEALGRIRDRAAVLSSPTVMVRAQDYPELAGERQSSIEIDIDWNDAETPTPMPVSASIKPVAIDLDLDLGEPNPFARKKTPLRLLGIAAGLAAGIAIGALSEQFIGSAPAENVAAATSIDPQPETTSIVETTSATAQAPATATQAAPTPPAKPTASADASTPKTPPTPPITNKAPASAPAAIEKPAAAPAPLPAKPAAESPKENDEDLSRFLDDRR